MRIIICMHDIQVVDNLIPPSWADQLEHLFVGQGSVLDWNYNPSTVGLQKAPNVYSGVNTLDTPQMTHSFFNAGFGGKKFDYFDGLILPIVYIMETHTDEKYQPDRIKANLLYNSIKTKGDRNMYGMPHTDRSQTNFKSMVYYVNDSDGDTVLFEEYENHEEPDIENYSQVGVDTFMLKQGVEFTHTKTEHNAPESLTEVMRVSPKKGRAVIFDSNRFHCSSTPVDSDFRCIINFVMQKI